MRKTKPRATPAKAKRGFAVLDRADAIEVAAAAVGLLRTLFKFARSSSAWRGGLGYALELLEVELNDILLFSSAKRLPDDLLGDAEAVAVPADLGEARKDAAGAVKVLKNILQDARDDLSVNGAQCYRLDNALDRLEEELNRLLPPPGAPPRAKLPFDDDGDVGSAESDLESGESDGMTDSGGSMTSERCATGVPGRGKGVKDFNMDNSEALERLDDIVGWLCDNGPEGWQDWHGWWSDTWDWIVDINERRVRDSEDFSVDDTQMRAYDQSETDEAYACALEMKAEIEEYLRRCTAL